MFGKEREPTSRPLFSICVIIGVASWNILKEASWMHLRCLMFPLWRGNALFLCFCFLWCCHHPLKEFCFFQLAFAGRTLPSSPLWLRPGVNVVPSAVTFSTLYPTPVFEVLSLPGFELPFVFYPAQCLSPELCLVWNCQSHRPHFNTGRSFFLFFLLTSNAESLSIDWTHSCMLNNILFQSSDACCALWIFCSWGFLINNLALLQMNQPATVCRLCSFKMPSCFCHLTEKTKRRIKKSMMLIFWPFCSEFPQYFAAVFLNYIKFYCSKFSSLHNIYLAVIITFYFAD